MWVKRFVFLSIACLAATLSAAMLQGCKDRHVDELVGKFQCSDGSQRFTFGQDNSVEWETKGIGGSIANRGKFSNDQGILILAFTEGETPDLNGGKSIESETTEWRYQYKFMDDGHLNLHQIYNSADTNYGPDTLCEKVHDFNGPLAGPPAQQFKEDLNNLSHQQKCEKTGEIANAIVGARDRGVPVGDLIAAAKQFDVENLTNLVQEIYNDPDLNPIDAQKKAFSACMM